MLFNVDAFSVVFLQNESAVDFLPGFWWSWVRWKSLLNDVVYGFRFLVVVGLHRFVHFGGVMWLGVVICRWQGGAKVLRCWGEENEI